MVPVSRGVYQEDENMKNITHSSDKHKLSTQDSLRIREYEFELEPELSDLPIKQKGEQVQWPRGRNSTRDKKAVRMLENTSGFTQLTTGHRSWLLVFLSFNLCACVYHRCSGACGARRGEEILRNWSCEEFVRSQAWEL